MNFDAIVREWFYRLPKGYADAPYTDAELAVLNEVLSKNGIALPEAKLEKEKFTEPEQMRNEVDQLDQAFNDAEPVENLDEAPKAKGTRVPYSQREREATTTLTPKEIAALLIKQPDVIPDEVLTRISKLLQRTKVGETAIREKLVTILGRDADRADEILDIILDGKTDETKFGSYLANRTIAYDEFLDSPKSYSQIFQSTGISKQALGDLIEYKWSANPNLGIAEVALAILLKGGSRPAKKGDLAIDGKPFEVGGIGKRLKGQKGFGGPNDIRAKFISEYEKLAEKYNQSGIVPTDDNRWGTSKSKGWLATIQEIQSKLANENPNLKKEFADTLGASLTGLYQLAKPSEISNWVEPFINDDGTIDTDGFNRELMVRNMQYYIDLEIGDDRSNYFVVSDYDTGFIFPTTEEGIRSALPFLEVFNLPGFTPGASGSGVVPGIALKQ